MENIIRKGIAGQVNFSFFYWGFYFSAGYFACKKPNNFPYLMS